METIYRITDNSNQIYNIEFETVLAAKNWIYSHLNINQVLSDNIRPIKVKREN